MPAPIAFPSSAITSLVWYDGPQLALLESDGLRALAVAVPDRGDKSYPMLAVEVPDESWLAFTTRRVDLRSLFVADGPRKWTFDLNGDGAGTVLLAEAKPEDLVEDNLPGEGFFTEIEWTS